MADAATYTVKQRGLLQQGYLGYPPDELAKLTWGLRFTPSLCMVGALVGLATQTAWLHFTLAALGVAALVLPAHHPIDLLYNHGVRHLTGGPKLPPNPFPRRISCFLGGCMNLGIGLSFAAGALGPAYVLGALLVALQLVVIGANFCVASWLLEMGLALYGRGIERVSSEEAHRLVEQGAVLLDVRSAQEYAIGHLPGSVNVPLKEVGARTEELRAKNRPLVIYCLGGVRCHKAAENLKQAGVQDVHDLGAMNRW